MMKTNHKQIRKAIEDQIDTEDCMIPLKDRW